MGPWLLVSEVSLRACSFGYGVISKNQNSGGSARRVVYRIAREAIKSRTDVRMSNINGDGLGGLVDTGIGLYAIQ